MVDNYRAATKITDNKIKISMALIFYTKILPLLLDVVISPNI